MLYNDNSNYQYACHMGFFRAAGFSEGKAPGEAPGGGSYFPVQRININELMRKAIESGRFLEQGDIIEQEAKKLSIILTQGQEPELQKALQFLLREAIRNIPEHAETEDVWLCGQYWRNRDVAEIAILDEGIGIYNSITQNPVHRGYINTNEDALRWAIKPGISASFAPTKMRKRSNYWVNSGFGLYMISEICKQTDGWLTLVSGDECMRVFPNIDSIYRAHFKGTALGIRIKPSRIDKYQSIIERINKLGEETARGIENAFKEASLPSKGLSL